MKRILTAVAIFAALFAGAAQAQNLTASFKGQNQTAFSVDAADSITGKVGSIEVRFGRNSTTGTTVQDGTGAIYQSLIVNPYFLTKYVQVGATTKWINVSKIAMAYCSAGFSYIYREYEQYALEQISDQCVTANAVINKSN